MTKKPKDQFNSSLHTLIPEHIPYDTKLYEGITPYIQEHLWKHMHKDRVKKAVVVLDDPLMEYGSDFEMLKIVLKNFLPKVKKLLGIDELHQLKDILGEQNIAGSIIDRNIKQQFDLYTQNKITHGNIVKILQDGKKGYIDTTKPHTKKILNDTIPTYQKSVIANMMILMILEEEFEKESKKNISK